MSTELEGLLNQRRDINLKLKENLTKYIEEFLIQHPEVICLFFRGYTPSFNDGDPCEFTFYENVDYFHEYDFGDEELEDIKAGYVNKGVSPEHAELMLKYLHHSYSTSDTHNKIVDMLMECEDIFGSIYGCYGFEVLYTIYDSKLVEIVESYEGD